MNVKNNIFNTELGYLEFGDCLKIMPNIKDKLIDLILVDLPYGTSKNKWDLIIPINKLWEQFNRTIKPNGVIVLTAIQPFTSKLVLSNLENFKYEIIWEKTIGSGQLNIKHRPLRIHESCLIFYKDMPTYHEQITEGEPYTINRKVNYKGEGYGKQTDSLKNNKGFRHAKTIIKIPNPRIKNGHSTQKPVQLMDYFIKTFTNEGDVVLDCCCGSGTTLVSAHQLNRRYIGIENNEEYFNMTKNRLIEIIGANENKRGDK